VLVRTSLALSGVGILACGSLLEPEPVVQDVLSLLVFNGTTFNPIRNFVIITVQG